MTGKPLKTSLVAPGLATVAIAIAALLPAAGAEAAPPPPESHNGHPVTAVAGGVGIPTAFAFKGNRILISGAAAGPFKGGIYIASRSGKGGKAKLMARSPKHANSLVLHKGRLFVASGRNLFMYRGWNGKGFTKRNVVYKGAKGFTGFTQMAIGPDGRLYAGVELDYRFDASRQTTPFGQSVVSIGLKRVLKGNKVRTIRKKDIRVETRGLRQPWGVAFASGIRQPFVTVLGQDTPENNGAPDLIVRAGRGQDYGFPVCNWLDAESCEEAGHPAPFATFPAQEGMQPSPMGIAARGSRLYVALHNGGLDLVPFADDQDLAIGNLPAGPSVVSVDTDGVNTGWVSSQHLAPVIAVGVRGNYLFTGDLTGTIWRQKI